MFGIPLDLEDFISTFIRRMRRHEKIRSAPSIRQGIALFHFLNARFHRVPPLGMKDLLNAAVVTTHYLDQLVAYEIALELIQSALYARIADSRDYRTHRTYEQVLTLEHFGADYLKDIEIIDKLMKADSDIFLDPSKFMDEIYNAMKNDLTLKDLQFLESRGKLEENLPDIADPELSMYANKLLGNEDQWKSQLQKLMNDSSRNMEKILDNLKEMGTASSEIKEVAEKYLDGVQNWKEYLDILQSSKEYMSPSDSLLSHLSTEDLQEVSSQLESLSKMQKHHLDEDITEFQDKTSTQSSSTPLLNKMKDILSPDSFQQNDSIPQGDQMRSEQWTLEKMKQALNELSSANPTPHLDSDARQKMQQHLSSITKEILDQSTNPDQFLQNLQEFVDNQIPFDSQHVQEKATQIGVDQSQLDSILNQPLKKLKEMIQKNLGGMGRYTNMIPQALGDANVSKELIQHGIESQNSDFLGAMAQYSLDETANAVASLQDPKMNALFLQGIRKAPGDNLLKSWFLTRSKISPQIRGLLREYLQQIIVDKARFVVKSQMGKLKHGLMSSSHDLRYYRSGDPISQVNLEATMDHLLDQGKNLSDMNANDILCRKEAGSSIKSFLILDKSGSMEGTKMKLATFSAAILTSFLKQDDLAIVLFDSDSHVVKTFTSQIDIASLVSSLLDLSAEGGTQIGQSFNFIAEECSKCPINQKYLIFLFSDLAVYEPPHELKQILNRLQKYQFDIHIFHSETPEKTIFQCFETFFPVHLHQITSIELIPQILTNAFLTV
jgi:hypothetical protein